MLTLGRGHGGAVGRGAEWVVALGLGTTGRDDPRRPAGDRRRALPHRRLARRDPPPLGPCRPRRPRPRARDAARQPLCSRTSRASSPCCATRRRPSTSSTTTPISSPTPPAVLFQAEPEEFEEDDSEHPTEETLFAPLEPSDTEYTLPDPALLHVSKPGSAARTPRRAQRVAQALVTCLANFGVDATVIGQISGPRVTRYELQLAPGTKVGEGRPAEGRPELRARDDRDPHPRADPRQAGRRRRGAEPQPEPGHARRHLRRGAGDREPALGVARQGHLRRRRLDRPRADAASADRRHDRLGQVGLHQRDPHLDPAARDAGRGAADPDRPEADRAELLRVDPASPDAGRLEPEGGARRPAQRRHRDGAPLRAARAACGRATCPRRTARCASAARRSCRISSSSSTSSPT